MMNRYSRLFLFILIFVAGTFNTPAFGQIKIERSDWLEYLSKGNHTATNYSTATGGASWAALNALIQKTGSDQTWDLTGLTFPDVMAIPYDMISLPCPGSDTPGFETADFAWKVVEDGLEMYIFYDHTSDSTSVLGSFSRSDMDDDGTLDDVASVFSPETADFIFPLEYGDKFTRTQDTKMYLNGELFPFTTTTTETREVVGWGKLKTPHGSDNALMVKHTTSVSTMGLPGTTSVLYTFQTKHWLTASISVGEDGVTASAAYTVLDGEDNTAAEPDPSIPDRIALDQNYPNPFNPVTNIGYELKQSGYVWLKVFDVLGQEVATLVDGIRPTGTFTVTFDATGLPSGIYTYRLESAGQVLNRTMTLVK